MFASAGNSEIALLNGRSNRHWLQLTCVVKFPKVITEVCRTAPASAHDRGSQHIAVVTHHTGQVATPGREYGSTIQVIRRDARFPNGFVLISGANRQSSSFLAAIIHEAKAGAEVVQISWSSSNARNSRQRKP